MFNVFLQVASKEPRNPKEARKPYMIGDCVRNWVSCVGLQFQGIAMEKPIERNIGDEMETRTIRWLRGVDSFRV